MTKREYKYIYAKKYQKIDKKARRAYELLLIQIGNPIPPSVNYLYHP